MSTVNSRTCRDCPADISHRSCNAQRCELCAATHNAATSRRRSQIINQRRTADLEAAKLRQPRTCRDCPADISLMSANALRCPACANLEKNRKSRTYHKRRRRQQGIQSIIDPWADGTEQGLSLRDVALLRIEFNADMEAARN